MTIDEAKTIIKHYDGYFIGHSSDEVNEALEIAIASLEAWGKVKAEIDEQYDRVHPYNISCAEGLEMALGIIDKHIKEVQHDD